MAARVKYNMKIDTPWVGYTRLPRVPAMVPNPASPGQCATPHGALHQATAGDIASIITASGDSAST
jgi:hypothetical protein